MVGASNQSILEPQNVVGSIPCQGTHLGCRFDPPSRCIQEATGQCFSLTSMFLSLKSINVSLGEDLKKKGYSNITINK